MGRAERRFKRESKGTRALRSLQRVVEQHQKPIALREDTVPKAPCGHCAVVLEAATNAEGAKPSPGDFSVCWACAGVNRFTEGLGLSKVTDAELSELSAETVDVDMLEESRAFIRAAMMGAAAKGGQA